MIPVERRLPGPWGWVWSDAYDGLVMMRDGILTGPFVSGTLLWTRDSVADPSWLVRLRKGFFKQRSATNEVTNGR